MSTKITNTASVGLVNGVSLEQKRQTLRDLFQQYTQSNQTRTLYRELTEQIGTLREQVASYSVKQVTRKKQVDDASAKMNATLTAKFNEFTESFSQIASASIASMKEAVQSHEKAKKQLRETQEMRQRQLRMDPNLRLIASLDTYLSALDLLERILVDCTYDDIYDQVQLKSLQAKNTHLKAQIEQLNNDLQSFGVKRSLLRAQNNTLKQKLVEFDSKLTDLQRMIQEKTTEIGKEESKLEVARQSNQQLENRIRDHTTTFRSST